MKPRFVRSGEGYIPASVVPLSRRQCLVQCSVCIALECHDG